MLRSAKFKFVWKGLDHQVLKTVVEMFPNNNVARHLGYHSTVLQRQPTHLR